MGRQTADNLLSLLGGYAELSVGSVASMRVDFGVAISVTSTYSGNVKVSWRSLNIIESDSGVLLTFPTR